MKKAWERANLAQHRFGGKASQYFKEALTFTWMLEKLPDCLVMANKVPALKKVYLVPGKGRSKIIILNASRATLQDDGTYVLHHTYCSTIKETEAALLVQATVADAAGRFLYTTEQWVPKSAVVYESYYYLKVKPFVNEAFLQPVHLILD